MKELYNKTEAFIRSFLNFIILPPYIEEIISIISALLGVTQKQLIITMLI